MLRVTSQNIRHRCHLCTKPLSIVDDFLHLFLVKVQSQRQQTTSLQPSRRALFALPANLPVITVDSSKAQTLAAETGARAVSSAKEMAEGSSSIITMLPNTSNVEAVYLGDPELSREGNEIDSSPSAAAEMVKRRNNTEMGFGLLDWVRSGTLLVDSSTIDPLASRRVNAIAKSKVRRSNTSWRIRSD